MDLSTKENVVHILLPENKAIMNKIIFRWIVSEHSK